MSDFIIENVPLTKDWLADLVEKKLGVRPRIGTSGILDNSDLGYMSMIRKVQLHFDDEEKEKHVNLPKHVVLKIACSAKGSGVLETAGGETAESPETTDVEKFMHNTECNYYSLFSKYDEKPLQVPIIYETAKAEDKTAPIPVIVMEMFEDCHVYDLIRGFDEGQLYKIIDQIIKLHIFSLTTEQWKEIRPDPTLVGMTEAFHGLVRNISDNLAKQPGLDIISVFVRNTFEKNVKFLVEYAEDYYSGKRQAVITHGDLWAPQILWDKEDNIAGIIDWQLTHSGGPMEDIHHILATCTSVENRQKLTKPLLDYYFDKLSAGLEAKGVKIPWTREQIDEEYKHTMIYSCAMTIFANGFWSNSPVLHTDGKRDEVKIAESFARCKSFVEQTIREHNME